MIANFSVYNYRSIGRRQQISFVSTSDKTNKDFLTEEVAKGVFINKVGIFFGANASGKSNILQAIQSVFSIMSIPKKDKNDRIKEYIPFRMIAGTPAEMSIDFYLDGIKYTYEVSYNQKDILRESLIYVPSRSKALIYSRELTGDDTQPWISFGTTLNLSHATKETLKENTFNNSSVLSSVSKLSLKEDANPLIKILKWIEGRIITIDNIDSIPKYAEELQKIDKNEEKRSLYIQLLAKADFNISNFRVIPQKEGTGEGDIEVMFTSRTQEGTFETPIQLQSEGTLRFIELIDVLYNVGHGNYVYLLDELGNKLHFELIAYFLRLFLHSADASQILFTTQSILLLDEDFLRNDAVYLTEKDPVAASTAYQRVSDMGLRKTASLYKMYRMGKLGSIPEVGSPYLNLK